MKTVLKLLLFLSLSIACFGAGPTCPQKESKTTSTSASTIPLANDCSVLHGTFEYVITGSPATMSAVLSGCMRGGSACTVLDTYTGTTSISRKPTIDATYDYFIVVPTWTGGTSPTFTVNDNLTQANGGGSTVTGSAPIVVTANNVTCPTCGTGSGNVAGAASSVNGHFAIFSGATGKVLADSLAAPAASATTDTTNANNITSGLLDKLRIPPAFRFDSLNANGVTSTILAVGGAGGTYPTLHDAIAACPTVGCIVWDMVAGENLTNNSAGNPIQPYCSGTWSATAPATCTAGSWKFAEVYLGYGAFNSDYPIFFGSGYARLIGANVSVGGAGAVTGTIIKATANWDQTGPDPEHPMVIAAPLFTGSNYQFATTIERMTFDCSTASAAGKACGGITNNGTDENSLFSNLRIIAVKPPTATSATTSISRSGCPGTSCKVTVTVAAVTGCTTGCVVMNGQQIKITGSTSVTDSFNQTGTVIAHTEAGGITTSFDLFQESGTATESATVQGTIKVSGEFAGSFGNGGQNSKWEELYFLSGATGYQDADTNGIVLASYSLRGLWGITAVIGNGTTPNDAILVAGSNVQPSIHNIHCEGWGLSCAHWTAKAGGSLDTITVGTTTSGYAINLDPSTLFVNATNLNITVAGTLALVRDATFTTPFVAATNVGHAAYYTLGFTGTGTHTWKSDLKAFADIDYALSFIEQSAPTIQAAAGLVQDPIYASNVDNRLHGKNSVDGIDAPFVMPASTDTLTHKTFDTAAGASNVFKINGTTVSTLVPSTVGGTGANLSAAPSGTYPKSNGASPAVYAASTLAAAGIGTCTNQVVTATNGDAVPTCATIINAMIASATIDLAAKVTGVLPQANGGLGTGKIAFTPPTTAGTVAFGVDNATITFQGTDTYIGKATTDTLTNKTFDTTGTGNVFKFNQTNAQTTTYQVLAADFASCKHIPVSSGTFTITLVASGSQPPDGQCVVVQNYGSGIVTVARSGQNINGAASNVTINAASATNPNSVLFRSDGTNYESEPYGNLFNSGASCGAGLAAVGNGTNQIQCLTQLTFNASGVNTKYNNETTTGLGFPFMRGNTSQKAETAADTNVLTVTPASTVGAYRACFNLSVSAASAATLGWTATWTDSNGTAQTPTNLSLFQTGVAAPALTFTTSVAANYYNCVNFDVNNAGTSIVVKLTFSGTSFTAKATASIERISN